MTTPTNNQNNKRPVPVIIVAALFILVGCMGFIYHFKEIYDRSYQLGETILILALRILAVICGIMLWYKINWARWLAIAWLAYHVIIGALNSTSEMLIHIAFLILVTILLFLPASSRFFKNN